MKVQDIYYSIFSITIIGFPQCLRATSTRSLRIYLVSFEYNGHFLGIEYGISGILTSLTVFLRVSLLQKLLMKTGRWRIRKLSASDRNGSRLRVHY